MSMFRREVLERLATPDGLDQLMQITRPTGWLGLVALAAVLAAAVVWGFFWEIPTTLDSQGVVAPTGGVEVISAPSGGRLREVAVKAGDIVQPGQAVATLASVDPADTATVPLTATSPARVIALSAGAGDLVDRGAPVVTLQPFGRPLEIVLYVPLDRASSIRPGMEVQVSPAGLPANVFGYLRGTVTSVGSYPATARDMKQVLGTDELVRSFSASGPPIEVRVTPNPDADHPSGYSWSTPKGPPFPLTGGTFATAKTITSKQTPFRLVF